jgi:hypothetical protein
MIKYIDEIWKTEEIKYNKCTINLAHAVFMQSCMQIFPNSPSQEKKGMKNCTIIKP